MRNLSLAGGLFRIGGELQNANVKYEAKRLVRPSSKHLERCQRLVEETDSARYTGPPEHRLAMEKMQQLGDLEVLVNAVSKPGIQYQKALENAQFAVPQFRRAAG